jgi:preprotein translocase subunit SecG
MYVFITIVIIIISALIMLFVLAQNPKGGGANAMMGGISNQVLGARRSGDFLEKGTWYLGIALFTCCLLSAFLIDRDGNNNTIDKETNELLKGAPTETSTTTEQPSADPADTTK